MVAAVGVISNNELSLRKSMERLGSILSATLAVIRSFSLCVRPVHNSVTLKSEMREANFRESWLSGGVNYSRYSVYSDVSRLWPWRNRWKCNYTRSGWDSFPYTVERSNRRLACCRTRSSYSFSYGLLLYVSRTLAIYTLPTVPSQIIILAFLA